MTSTIKDFLNILTIFLIVITIAYLFYEAISSKIKIETSFISKLLSTIFYILPFLDICIYFYKAMVRLYPSVLLKLLNFINPIIAFLHKFPYINTIIYIFIYILFIKTDSIIEVNKFVKFNALQSLLISMVISFCTIFLRFIPSTTSLYYIMFENIICVYFLFIILYCTFQTCRGKYTQIPIISDSARYHTDPDFDL
uniref:Tic20 family protein Ycf60 n=1 Tax=Bulboplastis apyrenoidosa TaxID=1070855 RepID=A0A1X9PVT1_9RHOD|nr:conserved hypothetical plastid protein [Bulboplastis apyrenoidosa]ARO90833.1 conserved hypothetical plastid protein [Bulboplastis apyrenoidosa]